MALPVLASDALPNVLVPPMLRRLTRTQITVFAVLRNNDPSRLTDPVEVIISEIDGSEAVRNSAIPLRIGRQLAIVLVTVRRDAGFLPEQIYNYMLAGNAFSDLDSTYWSSLAVEGRPTPSFIGLPDGPSLRLVHTSCRKPHGGARDAMGLVARQLDQPNTRPHLMILTGDQIYADDVSPALFLPLRAVARELVDRPEQDVFDEAPRTSDTDTNGASLPPRDPFTRTGARLKEGASYGLTSGAAHNQLWLFEEFVAHYLLAWSPALWTLPVFDGNSRLLELVYDTADHQRDVFDKFVSNQGLLGGVAQVVDEVARGFANVPCLMIFDDHEVTDDWNLNYRWVQRVYSNDAGRRIIANGLAAYCLFQHWGNAPERFVEGTAARDAIGDFLFTSGVPNAPLVSTTSESVLGLPGRGANDLPDSPVIGNDAPLRLTALGNNPGNVLRYDVTLYDANTETVNGQAIGNPPRIVLLDGRTRRGFADIDDSLWRTHPDDLALMLPGPPEGDDRTTIVVEPIPVFNIHLLEHIIQPAATTLKDAIFADSESWTGEPLEVLIQHLADYPRVVLLGGDVHYGFTRRVDFREQTAGPGARERTFVQFCASAAKNSDTKTMALHRFGALTQSLDLTRRRTMRVFDRDRLITEGVDLGIFTRPPPDNPALPYDDVADIALGRILRRAITDTVTLSDEVATAYGLQASWQRYQYTLELVDDERIDESLLQIHRNAAAGVHVPPDAAGWRGWSAARSASVLNDLQFFDAARSGRVISGLPQIGVVTLSESGASQTLVQVPRHPDLAEGAELDPVEPTNSPFSTIDYTLVTRADYGVGRA